MQNGFDIAVARLDEPIKEGNYARLPDPNVNFHHNMSVHGIGWGKISSLEPHSDGLQIATDLTVVERVGCPGMGKLEEHMLCIDSTSVGTMEGDQWVLRKDSIQGEAGRAVFPVPYLNFNFCSLYFM